MTTSLKLDETAVEFGGGGQRSGNEVSAELLGLQSTTFDGLTRPGPWLNGLNVGK